MKTLKRLVVYVTETTKPYVRSYGNGNVGIGAEHDGSDTHCIRPYCHLIHKITCQLQHLENNVKNQLEFIICVQPLTALLWISLWQDLNNVTRSCLFCWIWGFHKLVEIGNTGIRGFTMWKHKFQEPDVTSSEDSIGDPCHSRHILSFLS